MKALLINGRSNPAEPRSSGNGTGLRAKAVFVILALTAAVLAPMWAESASAASPVCTNVKIPYQVNGYVAGSMTMTLQQRFCWTGNNVYAVDGTLVTANVSTVFSLAGWDYKGLQSSRLICTPGQGMSRYYCDYTAQGKFVQSQYSIQMNSWYPTISVRYFYNGAIYYSFGSDWARLR